MLTKEDELVLESLIQITLLAKANRVFPQLSAYEIEWILKQLKKTNDELKIDDELSQ